MDTFHANCEAASRTRWMVLPLGSLVLLSALVLSAANCTFDPPRYRVAGLVTCNGVPAANAVVVFHPLDQALLVHPQAIADAEGRFELRMPLVGEGAPEGKYAVTVAWHPWTVAGEHYGPGSNAVAQDYTHPRRTPLRVQVAPTTNQLSPWQVPSSGGREE